MLLVHKNVYALLNIRMGLRTKRTTPHVICTSASEAVREVYTLQLWVLLKEPRLCATDPLGIVHPKYIGASTPHDSNQKASTSKFN